MKKNLTRREFVQTATVAGAALSIPKAMFSRQEIRSCFYEVIRL